MSSWIILIPNGSWGSNPTIAILKLLNDSLSLNDHVPDVVTTNQFDQFACCSIANWSKCSYQFEPRSGSWVSQFDWTIGFRFGLGSITMATA